MELIEVIVLCVAIGLCIGLPFAILTEHPTTKPTTAEAVTAKTWQDIKELNIPADFACTSLSQFSAGNGDDYMRVATVWDSKSNHEYIIVMGRHSVTITPRLPRADHE
jgi:hypothetical protein